MYPSFDPPEQLSRIYGGIYNVDVDDAVHGCWKWLLQKSDLMDLLGKLPGPEPRTPMLFEYEMQGTMEGKQTNAVVVRYGGGWSAPNAGNTMKFPKILLDFWCDPMREEYNKVIDPHEVDRRITYIFEKFDKYMHRPAAIYPSTDKVEWFGTVRTIECTRLGEFTFDEAPNGDGLLIGQAAYGIMVG